MLPKKELKDIETAIKTVMEKMVDEYNQKDQQPYHKL
jgi:hypothetical protein